MVGQPASEFAALISDRLACFVEEVTAHGLEAQMLAGIAIPEVPHRGRSAEVPERFKVTIAVGGIPPWTIAFHETAFDET
jgi:hypothetical protein